MGQYSGWTWQHHERRILEKKRSWRAARLCQDLTHELEAFSSHFFGFEITEEPDYNLLREKLTVFANEGDAGAKFDWEEPGRTGECYFMTSAHYHLISS